MFEKNNISKFYLKDSFLLRGKQNLSKMNFVLSFLSSIPKINESFSVRDVISSTSP